MGFDVTAVDKILCKSPKVMVTKLDLTQVATQKLVLGWIRLPQVKAVFMAPPCGTASKARTIQIPGETSLPRPLRTADEPDGIQNLTGNDFVRVEQSNILYDFTAQCHDQCCELDKLFACENPRDSLFWLTTPWTERKFQLDDHDQAHQACAYGSSRPKWTKLSANFPEVQMVNKICPGNHVHEPWGLQQSQGHKRFATSLEVHYPSQLCEAIADAFTAALHRKGISPHVAPPMAQAARAFSNLQASTNKLPPFVPEYKCKFATISFQERHIWPQQVLNSDAKLLHECEVGGADVVQLCHHLEEQCATRKVQVKLNESELAFLDRTVFLVWFA